MSTCHRGSFPFFFFNDTATTEIYTLSLHDALPILLPNRVGVPKMIASASESCSTLAIGICEKDRKSTRLNSSHQIISYAVFCLKKKNHIQPTKLRRPSLPDDAGGASVFISDVPLYS